MPPLTHSQPFPRAEFFGGLAAFVALALLFRFTGIDLAVARLAYSALDPHWPGQSAAPWSWLHDYGPTPSLLAGALGLLGFIASFISKSKKKWRGPGLYLFLVLTLGPGLLVNVLGKGLAGRPRPSDLLEFGGPWEFHRVFDFGTAGRGKAFLSGHAASAFYWFVLYFLLPRGRRAWGLAFALAFGGLMTVARILQGGHFLSDNLLCACAMFCVAAGLSPLIHWQPSAAFFRRREIRLALAGLVLGWLVIANPIFEERRLLWLAPGAPAPPASAVLRSYDWREMQPGLAQLKGIDLLLESDAGDIAVRFDGEAASQGQLPLAVDESLQALALPGAKESLKPTVLQSSPAWPLGLEELGINLQERLLWPFWGLSGGLTLHLPAEKPCEVRLKSKRAGITIGTLPKNAQVLLSGRFNASALPEGFSPYGMNSYHREGSGPLLVLRLDADTITFEP